MKTGDILRNKGFISADEIPDLSEWTKQQSDTYNESTGNLNEKDGYNCELCKNRGYFSKINENGIEYKSVCKCQTIRATCKRVTNSGLGDIIKDLTFDKFKATEQWQIDLKNLAQAFCKDDAAKWFFIGGQSGSGKTHICSAISRHYLISGIDLKYMIWAEEAKRLKALVNEYNSYQELINIYKKAPVLYIDDFLKTKAGEDVTKGDINIAFEIINYRTLKPDLITIISSEKTLDDLIEYDEATMSRIFQKTGKYRLNIKKDKAKNYRLKDLLING